MSALSDYLSVGPIGIDSGRLLGQLMVILFVEFGITAIGGSLAILLALRNRPKLLRWIAGDSAQAFLPTRAADLPPVTRIRPPRDKIDRLAS